MTAATRTYLFVGDTHNDLAFVEKAAALAAERDAEIVQVGDFGFVWPHLNTKTMRTEDRSMMQLEALLTALARAGKKAGKPPVPLRFIDGNHDWHPKLRELVDRAIYDTQPEGATQLCEHVIYQSRGSVHQDEDGTRFLFLGGAPSIDRASRTRGVSWWPEEIISEEEFAIAMSAEEPIHVLVTHDAPDYPPGFRPIGNPVFDAQSARSMQMIRMLVHKYRPELLIHGHWHSRYRMKLWNTLVAGLGSNFDSFSDAVMLWSRE